MDPADYDSAVDLLLPHLTRHVRAPVRNAYVRTVHGSKYLYLHTENGNGTLEVTICYDRFYQVPVLYFRRNGRVSASAATTAEIHPLLHTPYNMVHPCETKATMAPAGVRGLEYMKLWLAVHATHELAELRLVAGPEAREKSAGVEDSEWEGGSR